MSIQDPWQLAHDAAVAYERDAMSSSLWRERMRPRAQPDLRRGPTWNLPLVGSSVPTCCFNDEAALIFVRRTYYVSMGAKKRRLTACRSIPGPPSTNIVGVPSHVLNVPKAETMTIREYDPLTRRPYHLSTFFVCMIVLSACGRQRRWASEASALHPKYFPSPVALASAKPTYSSHPRRPALF